MDGCTVPSARPSSGLARAGPAQRQGKVGTRPLRCCAANTHRRRQRHAGAYGRMDPWGRGFGSADDKSTTFTCRCRLPAARALSSNLEPVGFSGQIRGPHAAPCLPAAQRCGVCDDGCRTTCLPLPRGSTQYRPCGLPPSSVTLAVSCIYRHRRSPSGLPRLNDPRTIDS